MPKLTVIGAVAGAVALGAIAALASPVAAQDITLRLSTPATPADQRAVALTEVFAPAVADFASFGPHWNATLFRQGTELEAIAELEDFFRAEGLEVYEPDVEVFRSHVQAAYLAFDFAKDWPEGMLDQIKAIE